MAIKTKKISELGQIDVADIDILKKADFYFLGCMGGVTGKVSTSDVVNAIRANVESISKDAVQTWEMTRGKSTTSEISTIMEKVANLEVLCEVLSKKVEETPASVSTTDVSSLEAKVAALEGFVKALQADGYLTLANIKKAAADACPIETSAE